MTYAIIPHRERIALNILICDDNRGEASTAEKIIKNSGYHVNTIVFNNGADTLAYIRSGAKVDACFLDIIMPEMTGTVLASLLREEGFRSEIIFMTTSNEYAAESYKVDAFSYLLKPPDAETVTNILRKMEDEINSADSAGIPVVTRNMSRFLLFYEISYIEVMQHKIFFHLTDRSTVEANMSLGELLPKLMEDGRFARCHRSFVVNMNAVSYVQDRDIVLRCSGRVPISKSYLHFSKQYLNWVFGGDM